jgi:hypothetical protein
MTQFKDHPGVLPDVKLTDPAAAAGPSRKHGGEGNTPPADPPAPASTPTPDPDTARDERYTVAQQLSRIFVYNTRKRALSLAQRITWASDDEKLTAARNHSVMTGGVEQWL